MNDGERTVSRITRRAVIGASLAGAAGVVAGAVGAVGAVGAGASAGGDTAEREEDLGRVLRRADAGASLIRVESTVGELDVTPVGFPKSFAYEVGDRVVVNARLAQAYPLVQALSDGRFFTFNGSGSSDRLVATHSQVAVSEG